MNTLNTSAFGTTQSLGYSFYKNKSSLFLFFFCWKLVSVSIQNVRHIFTLQNIDILSLIF